MDFNFDDTVCLFIQHRGDKSVVKLQRDYEWTYETIEGECLDLGTLFSDMDIDDIIDSLRKEFGEVEIIDEAEIEDYIN